MPQKFRLAPSILSADFVDMKTALKQCADGGAHWIHVDVMDNQFVPNLTIGPPVVNSLRSKTDKFIDVHMMVIDPEKLVEPFAKAGADNITFHIEATDDPDGIIDLIQSFGCKVGISIKPKTPLDDLFPLLDKVDVALVMSVEPGFGGQGYLQGSNERITAIKGYLNANSLDRVLIEVDGGVKLHNAKEVLDAGADVLVAGSEVFKADDPIETIKEFYHIATNE